ncbi:UNKNOWN [Stylonychia lemnae]|uniref:Uncharacterized protein n=1 Tax=Stylonychia lemnae TaxID=5949 RepID=A0A078A5A6_STYLE|nr:UNKNOWN [Stylonychia lemnae]|eukprot:CDW75934.1 UNKNOWN [Stylonychia lemnae]
MDSWACSLDQKSSIQDYSNLEVKLHTIYIIYEPRWDYSYKDFYDFKEAALNGFNYDRNSKQILEVSSKHGDILLKFDIHHEGKTNNLLKFAILLPMFVKNNNCIIIWFDLTSRQSFHQIDEIVK